MLLRLVFSQLQLQQPLLLLLPSTKLCSSSAGEAFALLLCLGFGRALGTFAAGTASAASGCCAAEQGAEAAAAAAAGS
jgi:hypothetical protein